MAQLNGDLLFKEAIKTPHGLSNLIKATVFDTAGNLISINEINKRKIMLKEYCKKYIIDYQSYYKNICNMIEHKMDKLNEK